MARNSIAAAVLALLLATTASAASPPTPTEFLGFEVGADKQLADYRQISSYLQMLDRESPRVELVDLGRTTLGESMVMAVISSEENIRNLAAIKDTAKKLADPRGLTQERIDALVRDGKAVVLVTCNIHSTEIASSQMAMEWAHALATADDPETRFRLDNVVLLLVPSLNPDGQIMETEWYRKHLGTRFEGGRLPWLYHHYVGHDNNRDWFMLTQNETRALSRAIYHEWFPQIFIDEHQMGSTGPRMFIPPFSDPIDPDVHPLIWREINLIGSNMAFRLEQAGKAGVIYGYQFDAYWLGGTRNTGWWKNVTGLLLEVASARMASPLEVHPTDLRGGNKGLIDYKATINHPNPWPGGVWRMRDIMDYERIASDAALEIIAERREDFLRNIAVRAASAVAMGRPREAYRIPRDQRDPATARRLALLIADHGAEVITAGNGDFWIPLAQPYSRFVREMLEPQRYPEIRPSAAADILRPYDVATWTLPLMMGVEVERTIMPAHVEGAAPLVAPITRGERLPAVAAAPLPEAPFFAIAPGSPETARAVNAAVASSGSVWVTTESARDLVQAPVPFVFPAGTYWLDPAAAEAARAEAARSGVVMLAATARPDGAEKLRAPRVGIYKPWLASMDEGWTRWLLEQYGFRVESLDNATIRKGGGKATSLRARFDAIILPDVNPAVIDTGRPQRTGDPAPYWAGFPPEYEGGLDKEGAQALTTFVEAGGTLIAFNSSTAWAIEKLGLPVRNALASARPADFGNPGSLLRAHVEPGHPITAGLPPELAIFHDDAIVFETVMTAVDVERAILLTYPGDERDILLSGWIHGAKQLERKAAAVALTWGKGKVVLFGFRPQHRAQTHATFPLLFQSLYWSVRE